MPKRTGLGQRGLDLLISAAPGGKETDSSKEVSAEEKKNSRSKKAASGKKAPAGPVRQEKTAKR